MPAKTVTTRAAKVAVPGIVAIVVALTAAFGGFRTAAQPPPKRYAPGQVIDQTLFHTQIMRAYIAQAGTQKPGIPALHVELRVVNESERPVYRDPLITLGAGSGSPDLWKAWRESPSMLVNADGKTRQFLSAEVERPSGTDSFDLQPHIPAIVDTEWVMYRYSEKPGNIRVSVTGFKKVDKTFYDIPGYWDFIPQPAKSGDTGDAKPKMIATVHLPLSPSTFKPHPPVKKKPKHKHKKHRRPH